MIALQAELFLKLLGLGFLASKSVTDEAEFETEMLWHLRALLLSTGFEVKLDHLLNGIT